MTDRVPAERDPLARITSVDAQAGLLLGCEPLLAPGCFGLAPIVSWLARQSKTIEHYYRFSGAGSPVHALLHALFYATERVEFEPSKKADRIARYLTPYAIGVLAGAVAARIAAPDTRFDAEAVLALIAGDHRLRDALDRQTAVHRRASALAAEALTLFHEGQAQIEALNQSIQEERDRFNVDMSRRDTIYHDVINAAPADLRDRMHATAIVHDPGGVGGEGAPPASEHQALIAYYRSMKTKRAAARQARQAVFEQALAMARPEIQAEYAEVCSRLAAHSQHEQDLSQRVNAVREDVTERIRQKWIDSDTERSFSSQHLKFKHAGRYFDQYLETLVATMSTEGAFTEDLPRLVDAVAHCANGRSDGNDRQLAVAALTLLLSYRITGASDVCEYLDGIAASAPDCLSSAGRAFVARRAVDAEAAIEPRPGEIETVALETFLSSRVESPAPLLASTRYANVTVGDRHLWFPDCGESNLRNFLNLILYERTTQTYDWQRLTRLDPPVDARVLAFYQRHPRVADTCAQRVHDEWATAMADLGASVEYLLPYDRPVCEIGPGAENMAAVLKVLFGSDDLRRICEALARVNLAIQRIDLSAFDGDASDASAGANAINDDHVTHRITIHYASSSSEWEFSRRHYRMYERIGSVEQARNDLDLQRLFDHLTARCGTSTALMVLGPVLRKMTIGEMRRCGWFQHLSPCETLQAMLSARIDWVDDCEAIAITGMQHAGIMSDPVYRAPLEKLVLSIPPYGGGQEIRARIAQRIEEQGFVALSETASLLRRTDTYNALQAT